MVASYFITGTGWLFLWLIGAAVCGFLGALVAERTGSTPWLGGILGFFIGPVGVLVAALLPAERGTADATTGGGAAAWAMPSTDPSRSGSSADVAPAAEATLKTCPECAEQIQAAARVCRFCGHRFVEEKSSAPTTS
jgi:hypothetical protein